MLEQKSQASLCLQSKAGLYRAGMKFKDRLKAARTEADLTQRELAEKIGVTPQAVSGWERDEAVPEMDKLSAIARHVKKSVDWLLEDAGKRPISSEDVSSGLDAPPRRTLKVKGYVGAGGVAHYYAVNQGDLDDIRATEKDPPDAAAVEIMGTSLGRFFDRWYAIYNDVRSPVTDDLIGALCVVGLDDDRVLIKKIARNGKNFDLISNTVEDPPIKNVRIEWAAKVTDVRQR